MKSFKTIEIDGRKYFLIPVEEIDSINIDGNKDQGLCEKLRRYRVEKGITLKELSIEINIAETQLGRLERGQKANAQTQRKIESFLKEV